MPEFTVLQVARHYTKAGLSIVPKETGGKETFVEWKEFQTRIPTDDELREWFEGKKWEEIGISAVCGNVSGGKEGYGLVGLDFDNMKFWEPWLELTQELRNGIAISQSGSGKRHVWFRTNGAIGAGRKFYPCWSVDTEKAVGRSIGIECARNGSLLTLPPSYHPSGARYQWLQGRGSRLPYISEFRAVGLIAAAQSLDEAPFTKQQAEAAQRAKVKEEVRRWKNHNDRNESVIDAFNGKFSIEDMLERFRYEAGERGRYIRPDSVAKRLSIFIQENRSYHWSPEDPLHSVYWHTPFSIFCQLGCQDDVTEAVREAARMLNT